MNSKTRNPLAAGLQLLHQRLRLQIVNAHMGFGLKNQKNNDNNNKGGFGRSIEKISFHEEEDRIIIIIKTYRNKEDGLSRMECNALHLTRLFVEGFL